MSKQIIIVLVLMLTNLSQVWGKDYPAVFKAENFRLSTWDQYRERIKNSHKNYENTFKDLASLEYKGQSYRAKTIATIGSNGSYKYDQKLTYINIYEGLWRLIYVEGDECIKGNAFKDGAYVESWGCKELMFPISGVYGDIFVVDSENIDIEKLSQDWGKKVTLISDEDSDDIKKTLTLGDMKKIIEDKGASWSTEDTVWAGTEYNPKPESKALKINVFLQINETTKISQSYVYIIVGDLLKMREIDGKVCTFQKSLQKDICEEAYAPTQYTPFVMELVNSTELTGAKVVVEEPEPVLTEAPPEFSCGNIINTYTMALRVHFEKSIFSLQDDESYREALSKFAVVADPQSVFLSEKTNKEFSGINSEPYPLADLIKNIKGELKKGPKGNCDELIPFVDKLKSEVLEKGPKLMSLLKLIEEKSYDEAIIDQEVNSLDSYQQKLWNLIKLSKEPTLSLNHSKASLDVAAAFLLRYYKTTLGVLSDREEFVTAAFVKQDVYTKLLDESLVVSTNQSLYGHAKKTYFGIRVSSGYSNHYIHSLHEDTEKSFNLKRGDQIIKINGSLASEMSAKDVDDILAQTDKPLSLELERQGQIVTELVYARPIDLMKYFYSTELVSGEKGNQYIKIRINSFEAGLSESLSKNLKSLLSNNNVKGLILDLQSNPGGSVIEATGVISLFVKDRVPFYFTLGARALDTATATELKEELFVSQDLPLVVQVNSGTASSSEIVTSSLKAHNRALVVGSKTFGKLIGQSYFPVILSNNRSLAMVVTSTEYFDPQGNALNGKGVSPDLVVFSQGGGTFEDGNGEGTDYVVPEEDKVKPYSEIISEEGLHQIQKSIVIDESDIDEVSIRALDSV